MFVLNKFGEKNSYPHCPRAPPSMFCGGYLQWALMALPIMIGASVRQPRSQESGFRLRGHPPGS